MVHQIHDDPDPNADDRRELDDDVEIEFEDIDDEEIDRTLEQPAAVKNVNPSGRAPTRWFFPQG